MLEKMFIEQYPGKITDYVGNFDVEEFFHDKNTWNEKFDLFMQKYLVEGVRLADIPKVTNLSERTCSAFASDVLPTVSNYIEEKNNEEINRVANAIYKRAEEMNADYMDMTTGTIFCIQEYNRVKSFGLPVFGIRMVRDGVTIGYLPEPKNK